MQRKHDKIYISLINSEFEKNVRTDNFTLVSTFLIIGNIGKIYLIIWGTILICIDNGAEYQSQI